jgi:hypothetical protein
MVGMQLSQCKHVPWEELCVKFYLDSGRPRGAVCEVASVEVGFECTNRDNKLRTLDLLFNFWVRDRTNIDLPKGYQY